MNTIPQPAPLSEHAALMLDVFELLDSKTIGYKLLDLPAKNFRNVSAFVLAALDFFADEQQPAPAPRGTEEAE